VTTASPLSPTSRACRQTTLIDKRAHDTGTHRGDCALILTKSVGRFQAGLPPACNDQLIDYIDDRATRVPHLTALTQRTYRGIDRKASLPTRVCDPLDRSDEPILRHRVTPKMHKPPSHDQALNAWIALGNSCERLLQLPGPCRPTQAAA